MSTFELTMTVPADSRYGSLVAAVAREAARQAGMPEPDASRFTGEAEMALRQCLAGPQPPATAIEVVCRRADAALELTVTPDRDRTVARTVRIDV